MQAQRPHRQIDPGAVGRAHPALGRDRQRLGRDRLGVGEHGAGPRARGEGAVGEIGAVGEALEHHRQARRLRRGDDHGTGRRDQGQAVELAERPHHRAGLRLVTGERVVQGAVGLHPAHAAPLRAGHRLQRPDLDDHLVREVIRGDLEEAPAEALQVRIGDMRRDRDAACGGCPAGGAHRRAVPGVAAAGDVRGGDDLEHRGVVPHRPVAEALPEVGVEVDDGGGGHGRAPSSDGGVLPIVGPGRADVIPTGVRRTARAPPRALAPRRSSVPSNFCARDDPCGPRYESSRGQNLADRGSGRSGRHGPAPLTHLVRPTLMERPTSSCSGPTGPAGHGGPG